MDDFEEDVQYIVGGKCEGDIRRYWANKPLAEGYGNKAAEQWPELVDHITSELEPGLGFVSVLHSNGPIPVAHAAGFEVRDASLIVKSKTPENWAKPKKAMATTSPGTPSAPSLPKGGVTKKVWEIADKIQTDNQGLDLKALRPLIMAECEGQGINKATAGTQYSKWKRSKLGS